MKRKILSIMLAAAIASTSFVGLTAYIGTQNVLAAAQSNVQVKLNKTNLTLYKNEDAAQSVRLTATVTGSNSGVKWSSSDGDVAKVSSSGKVTAVSNGTAVITVTSKLDENAVATCNVTVKTPTKKVTAQKKIVRVDGTYDYNFNNLKITSYSQLKKVINDYEKIATYHDKKLLKQLKGYKKSFFNKKALLLNSMPVYPENKVTVGNVTKQMVGNGKFQINVDYNIKFVGMPGDIYLDVVTFSEYSFIEISKELSDVTNKVVYNEIRE